MKEKIGGLTIDQTIIDSMEPDRTPVEKGAYPVTIVSELKYKKGKKGGYYAQLLLKHNNPELKRKALVTVNFTNNEVGGAIFGNFLKALGYPKESLMGASWSGTQVDKDATIVVDGETLKIKGRELTVGLKVKESENGYPARNEVTTFKA